jgi:hypothetical protein
LASVDPSQATNITEQNWGKYLFFNENGLEPVNLLADKYRWFYQRDDSVQKGSWNYDNEKKAFYIDQQASHLERGTYVLFEPFVKLTVVRKRAYAFDLEADNEQDMNSQIEMVRHLLCNQNNLIPESARFQAAIDTDRVFWFLLTAFENHDAFIVKSPGEPPCVLRKDEVNLDYGSKNFTTFILEGKIPFGVVIEYLLDKGRKLGCVSFYEKENEFMIVLDQKQEKYEPLRSG